jgi:hypothetical protein
MPLVGTAGGWPLGAQGERREPPWAQLASGHCQLNEKSLTEAFLVRKADDIQVAKIEAIVKEEN